MLDNSSQDQPRTRIPWAVSIVRHTEPSPHQRSDEAANAAEAETVESAQPGGEVDADRSVAEDSDIDGANRHREAGAVCDEPEEFCDDDVVRSLMDILITPAGVVQPQERSFAADLLLQAVDQASPEAKRMLCDRLANVPDAPALLISRMVRDADLDLSATLLSRAGSVSDSELISIVEAGDRERSLLVARREHLTAAVGTALAKTGDPALALELVRNPYARLSQETVRRLSVLALSHHELLEPLVTRQEMTCACALGLFWSMAAKQRSYVLSRFLAEAQILPKILDMSKPGADLAPAAARSGSDPGRQRNGETGNPPAGPKGKASALVEALALGDEDTLAELIERFAGLDRRAAVRIVEDRGGEALVVACKALGISRPAFAEAFEKWLSATARGPAPAPLGILFDTLSFRQARMALTYWSWQCQNKGPYADPMIRAVNRHTD